MLSKKIAKEENMPNLTVPSEGPPTVAAPPQNNESKEQYARKIKKFRYFCSPDGYPTVILDKEGITEDVKMDPYWTGQITERDGVLGMKANGVPSHWFKRAERAAMWRQQKSLPDRRYTGAYVGFDEDKVASYYNAKPLKRDPALKKQGPYAQFINGISYVPKALIIREQPAVKLFTMDGGDPRQPSMQDLENDRKDPWYQTIANNLSNTRSYSRRTQIGADLLQNRNAVNRLNQLRHIKVYAPYGEGIGMTWANKPEVFARGKKADLASDPQPEAARSTRPSSAPANVGGHYKKVMGSGVVPHWLKSG